MKRLYRVRGWDAYWRERLRLQGARSHDSAAFLHVRLGNFDEAIRSLERLYELRHPAITWTNHPELDPLRSDPRFQALRQRVGLSDGINAQLAAVRRAAAPVNAASGSR
jgi:hypothetical protein